MQTIFGLVLPAPLLWVLALVFVLALVAIFGLILRRISGRRARLKGQGGARARQPRLGVIDIYDLDRQRQLVLLRRDNVEHLVMIGGPTDVVVETNILRGGARPSATTNQDGMGTERLEGDTVYNPAPAVQVATVPPAPPAAAPAMALPPAAPVPASARLEAGIPAPTRPAAAPLVAAAVAAASTRGGAPFAVETASAEAPLPEAIPASAMAEVPVKVDTPARIDAAAKVEPKPVFPLESAPAPKAPAADLDDMARQLEQALKRPFAAVRSSAPAVTAALVTETAKPDVKIADTEVTDTTDTKIAEAKVSEDKAPDIKAPEVEAPAIIISDRTEKPAVPPAPSTSSFEAFMEEQLKAAVEAAPVTGVKTAETVVEPVVKIADKAPELPDSVAAELQAAMAGTFKVVAPTRESAPEKAVDAGAGSDAPARPDAAATASGMIAHAFSTSTSIDKAADDKKTLAPMLPETVRPRSELKPETAGVRKDEGKKDEGKKDEAKKDIALAGDKPAAGNTPADAGESDPFSIDAIEMEFARLLGRDTKPKI